MSRIKAELYDRRDRRVTVWFDVVRGKLPYYSPSFGNWLPGDPPELVFDTAEVELGRNLKTVVKRTLTERQVDELVGLEAAIEAAE